MNKILNIIKIFLILLLFYFNIIYINRMQLTSNLIPIFVIIEIIFLIITLKDYLKRNDINNNKQFLILSIITLLITNFIYIRCLYDKNFVYNDYQIYKDLKTSFNNLVDYNQAIYINIIYLEQNVYYLLILFISLLMYRNINLKK